LNVPNRRNRASREPRDKPKIIPAFLIVQAITDHCVLEPLNCKHEVREDHQHQTKQNNGASQPIISHDALQRQQPVEPARGEGVLKTEERERVNHKEERNGVGERTAYFEQRVLSSVFEEVLEQRV